MKKITPDRLEQHLFIEHEKEGAYLTLPFSVPVDTESMTLTYKYVGYAEKDSVLENGDFVSRQRINIIDLGLLAPDGSQVGASGSDKNEIYISETYATPGYKACAVVPGEWRIIAGAYKVAQEGVDISYEITFNLKHKRLYKGDLHVHTLASDGIFTIAELMGRAQKLGLDFIAITDHNHMLSADEIPQMKDFCVIPGMEYTHYQGHANFLGVDKPYDDPYIANTFEDVRARFKAARERGALIVVNHPFQEGCDFQFDLNELPFDCLEVWNGPMRGSNFKAIGLWQQYLIEGKRIPICGGSDFHRDNVPFVFMGGPTTCVYAMSSSSGDILSALQQGHAYISYASNGPALELSAGEAIMGDSVKWSKKRKMRIVAENLLKGDVIRVVTADESKPLLEASHHGRCDLSYTMESPGFARIEILRVLLPGVPMLPVLVSNPLYFQDS